MKLPLHLSDRARSHLVSGGLVLLVFGVMLLGQILDNEHQASALLASAERQAVLQAQIDARIDRAAAAVCADLHVPGSLPRWTPANELVCLPPLSSPIAQGGQP